MRSLALFVLAAFGEIAGCFSFWAVFRLHRSPFWLLPGVGFLVIFAWTLTRVDAELAGRAFAAYGGIYIFTSLLWLTIVEGGAPDRWDLLGAALCVLGAGVILLGPR